MAKNIFIINPVAGQGEAKKLQSVIKTIGKKLKMDCEIYQSKCALDARNFCNEIAKKATKESKYRIFACGGDGTLNEVINGCILNDNISIGCIPKGTGNDFIRNFDKKYDFLNIEKQLLGTIKKCDSIKYSGIMNGEEVRGHCINMFNIGFDSNVIYTAAKLKNKPFISGSFAYILGVAFMFFKMLGASVVAEFEDGKIIDGDILLLQVANGKFCGGGIMSAPKSSVFDGLIDVSIVNRISRRKFFVFFYPFLKGTYLDKANLKNDVTYRRCKKFKVTSKNNKTRMGTDGEISDVTYMEYEIAPKSINLILPKV